MNTRYSAAVDRDGNLWVYTAHENGYSPVRAGAPLFTFVADSLDVVDHYAGLVASFEAVSGIGLAKMWAETVYGKGCAIAHIRTAYNAIKAAKL